MNNIINNLLSDFMQNNQNSSQTQTKNFTYPNFDNNFSNQNNKNNLINKLLPLLISGGNITDILPSLGVNNPLLSSVMAMQSPKNNINKIESDKIDISSLSKV